MKTTCSVRQSSLLGSLFWNVYYNDISRLEMTKGVTLIVFADDVAVVVYADTAQILQTNINIAQTRIKNG